MRIVRLVSLAAVVLAACDPAPEPGDVGITTIEITQGIQNVLDQVPLIAGKPTFVRVYVIGNTEGGAAVPAVEARLAVDHGAPAAPVGVTSVTPTARGSDPRTLGDSFAFALPATALTAGTHHLHVELVLPSGASVSDPAKLVRDLDVTLGPTGDPVRVHVYGIRYGYTGVPVALQQRYGLTSSTWMPRPFSDFELQRDGAEQMLPVAALAIEPLPNVEPMMFDCRYVGDDATGGCDGYLDARAWGHDVIDAAFPGGGETVVIMQPESTPGRFLGNDEGTVRNNSVINFQPDSSFIGATLAHELYHMLGVGHTTSTLPIYEVNYPRPDGSLGPYVGLRSRPALQLFPGDDLAGTVTGYDIMSYMFPQWASPFTYCRALRNASNQRLLCPRGLDQWDRGL